MNDDEFVEASEPPAIADCDEMNPLIELYKEMGWGCDGTRIRLLSGGWIDLLHPDPEWICFEDVAIPLSNICRFGGQIEEFYSVAEHSVNCAKMAEDDGLSKEVRLACLLHDATEAFLGDVIRPLKKILAPLYCPIEERWMQAIADRFEVDFVSTREQWKRIDKALYIAERKALFNADLEWPGEEDVDVFVLPPIAHSPLEAFGLFTREYERIVQ